MNRFRQIEDQKIEDQNLKITRTFPLFFRFFAIALIAFLPFSAGYAISIGDLTLKSSLGEPLHAQVDLQLVRGEAIDASCLSLSEVEDEGGFLPAGLTVSFNQSEHKAEIRSRKPFIEPFAIFRLKIKCSDMGSVSKVLTLLPELGATPAPQVVAATPDNENVSPFVAVHNEAERISEQPVTSSTHSLKQIRRSATVAGAEAPHLIVIPTSSQEASPRQSKTTSKRASSKHKKPNVQFRLKLSGEPLDLSHIGKLDERDRELLLARQKLLDEDEQTAQYLTMLHQLKLMQEEIGDLKLKMAELKGSASSVAAPQTVVAATQSTAANGPTWSNGQMLLGLFAAISLTWLWLSYVARRKSYALLPDISTKEHHVKPEIQMLKPASMVTPRPRPEKNMQIAHAVGVSLQQPDVQAEKDNPIDDKENEVLEEAELYAAHGHPDKGAKILHEFVAQHPTSEKAWMLLLSIYSSRGQTEVFESAAHNFLRHNKNSPLWTKMQALGRTLDQKNSLYVDENNLGPSSPFSPYLTQHKHRPIGDILVELNYLSTHDMENCLGDFDPKQHGRFGNYLVMRKQVSYAQLGEALMKQQASNTALQSDSLPTLQQMEDLLKDFNPQRDGSVEEFLMSRKESVAEHLAHNAEFKPQEMHKQKAARHVDTNEQGKCSPAGLVLNFDQDVSAVNKHPEFNAEDKSQPLKFDMDLTSYLTCKDSHAD